MFGSKIEKVLNFKYIKKGVFLIHWTRSGFRYGTLKVSQGTKLPLIISILLPISQSHTHTLVKIKPYSSSKLHHSNLSFFIISVLLILNSSYLYLCLLIYNLPGKNFFSSPMNFWVYEHNLGTKLKSFVFVQFWSWMFQSLELFLLLINFSF